MKVVVSACLLGQNCKYNGGNNDSPSVRAFLAGKDVVAICPEILVMPAPRPPVELRNGRAFDCHGQDVDAVYREGVRRAIRQIEAEGVDLVILKARSPTCGVHEIYDGTFTGKKIPGEGLLAAELRKRGYRVIDESEIGKFRS